MLTHANFLVGTRALPSWTRECPDPVRHRPAKPRRSVWTCRARSLLLFIVSPRWWDIGCVQQVMEFKTVITEESGVFGEGAGARSCATLHSRCFRTCATAATI